MDVSNSLLGRFLSLLRPVVAYVPFVFFVLALSTGSLGHWLDIDRPVVWSDFPDAFLGSVRYLVFDGFQAPMEVCTVSEVACEPTRGAIWIRLSQIFAVLFVVATADRVLQVASGQYKSLRFRVRARYTSGIDLVVGMGWHGTTLVRATLKAKSTSDQPQRTLCVDRSASPQAKETCSSASIPLIEVDADTTDWLHHIPMKNVARVFLSTGSDQTNAAVIRRLAPYCQSSDMVNRLPCFVSVNDFRTFDALVDDQARRILDIRPFNDATTTARLLYLQRTECYCFPPSITSSHWVIWGKGVMLDALLLHCLQNHVVEAAHEVQLDVVTPDARAAADRWANLYPCYAIRSYDRKSGVTILKPDPVWLREKILPTIRFHQMAGSARGQLEWLEGYMDLCDRKSAQVTVAVVFDDLAESVNAGRLMKPVLSERIRANHTSLGSENCSKIGLWVYLNTQESPLYANLESSLKDELLSVVVFGDHLGRFTKTSIDQNLVERAGMLTHAAYANALDTLPLPDIETVWRGVYDVTGEQAFRPPADEWARESSRLAGAHAWVKAGIRQRLHDTGFADDSKIQQELCRVEHRRWCAVHLLDGWRPLVNPNTDSWTENEVQLIVEWYGGKKHKMRQQRKHLCLMPFDRFDLLEGLGAEGQKHADSERTKDLNIVKATDKILSFAER